jgi:hypothetical protein
VTDDVRAAGIEVVNAVNAAANQVIAADLKSSLHAFEEAKAKIGAPPHSGHGAARDDRSS